MQDSKTPCRIQTESDMDLCAKQIDKGKCGLYKGDIGIICEMPDSTLNVYYTAVAGKSAAAGSKACTSHTDCEESNMCCGAGCAPIGGWCDGQQCGW